MPRLLVLAAAAASASASASSEPCFLTVSPDTPDALHAAQETIRAAFSSSSAPPSSDLLVCLERGSYALSRTLAFTAADSHPVPGRRTVFRSVGGAGAAVVTGAVPVVGWTSTTYNGAPAYSAAVPASLPAPAPGAVAAIRQLWVDGARASRVIAPSATALFGGSLKGWWDAATSTAGFSAASFPPGFGADTNAVRALEFTWPIVIDNWIAPRCTVASADAASANLTLSSPCGAFLQARGHGIPTPVTAEAVPGQALGPGTFYHDITAGKLYYSLAPGQQPADLETSAFVAGLETLISYNGSTGIAWEGAAFSFATWSQPNRPEGYVDDQSTVFACSPSTNTPGCFDGASAEPQGAVWGKASSGLEFTGCVFSHIGAAYALSIDEGSNSSSVTACNFTDLSGGFLKLGSIDEAYASVTPGPSGWDFDLSVSDSFASDMAVEFGGASGLFVGYTVNTSIVHNTVQDAGYDGMSMGWGWGANAVPLTGFGGNTVVGNRFSNVMHALRDGGGIYLNGKTNDAHGYTTVSGNWVDTDLAVYASYYLDNGSSYNNLTNNVVSNSPLAWGYYMQGCCNLPAYNSSISNFWYQNTSDPVNECAADGCVVDQGTVTKVPSGTPLPAAAQAIVDNSGVRPSVWAKVAAGDWEGLRRGA